MICEKLICPWSSSHTCGHVISPFIQSLFYIFQKCFKIYFINFYIFFNRLKCRYLTLWRRKWQPTPVFLSGKPHGQRSLVGYSPWGCKESNTIDATEHSTKQHHHHLTFYIVIMNGIFRLQSRFGYN